MRAAHYLLGLASGGVYIANCIAAITGGLLHRRFTLTTVVSNSGGLLSVALIPRIAPGGRYPPPCSMKSGLSSVSYDNAVIQATLLKVRIRQRVDRRETVRRARIAGFSAHQHCGEIQGLQGKVWQNEHLSLNHQITSDSQ